MVTSIVSVTGHRSGNIVFKTLFTPADRLLGGVRVSFLTNEIAKVHHTRVHGHQKPSETVLEKITPFQFLDTDNFRLF